MYHLNFIFTNNANLKNVVHDKMKLTPTAVMKVVLNLSLSHIYIQQAASFKPAGTHSSANKKRYPGHYQKLLDDYQVITAHC